MKNFVVRRPFAVILCLVAALLGFSFGARRAHGQNMPAVIAATSRSQETVTATEIVARLEAIASQRARIYTAPCAEGSVEHIFGTRFGSQRVACFRTVLIAATSGHHHSRHVHRRHHAPAQYTIAPEDRAQFTAWVWLGSAYSAARRQVLQGHGDVAFTAFWRNISDKLEIVGLDPHASDTTSRSLLATR